MNRSVMIVAGGTGGHVYPGLAVAQALRDAGVELYWMGTRRGLEARVVPGSGAVFETIPISGLRRAGLLRWLAAPITLCVAMLFAIAVIARIRPRVVLGMGGFVSGPGGVAAWLCRRPLVIHEQNAIPGLTNRLLSRLAKRILEAVPGTFRGTTNAVATGNPVRQAITDLAPPAVRLRARKGNNVLVFGGSGGARRLNEVVPQALALSGISDLCIRHQCGVADVEATRMRYVGLEESCQVDVVPYIENMAAAYATADLVIARAGALTVAEIAACGVASILVPYPYAVDDHQTANARYLVEREAALLMPESEMTAASLARAIADLLGDRTRLCAMAERARSLAQPDATAMVARHCLEFVDA